MLRDEYLLLLAVVYSSCNGKVLNKVSINDIANILSNMREDLHFRSPDFEKILSLEEGDITSFLLYLEENGYIKGQWFRGDDTILEGFINITAKGIDCIEDPFGTLSKEYPRIVTASNITNIKANGDVNIIQSAIIQKNIQNFSDTELKGLNDKLNELKNIISDTSLKELVEVIRKDLESDNKVDATQKLNKFQNFVTKMKDAGALIQVTLFTYKIISLIFHLPNIGL
jgi:hypothetical protein